MLRSIVLSAFGAGLAVGVFVIAAQVFAASLVVSALLRPLAGLSAGRLCERMARRA